MIDKAYQTKLCVRTEDLTGLASIFTLFTPVTQAHTTMQPGLEQLAFFIRAAFASFFI